MLHCQLSIINYFGSRPKNCHFAASHRLGRRIGSFLVAGLSAAIALFVPFGASRLGCSGYDVVLQRLGFEGNFCKRAQKGLFPLLSLLHWGNFSTFGYGIPPELL